MKITKNSYTKQRNHPCPIVHPLNNMNLSFFTTTVLFSKLQTIKLIATHSLTHPNFEHILY